MVPIFSLDAAAVCLHSNPGTKTMNEPNSISRQIVFTFESIPLVRSPTREHFCRRLSTPVVLRLFLGTAGACVCMCVLPAHEHDKPGNKSCIPPATATQVHVILFNFYWLIPTLPHIPASPGCSTEAGLQFRSGGSVGDP